MRHREGEEERVEGEEKSSRRRFLPPREGFLCLLRVLSSGLDRSLLSRLSIVGEGEGGGRLWGSAVSSMETNWSYESPYVVSPQMLKKEGVTLWEGKSIVGEAIATKRIKQKNGIRQ